MFFYLLDVADGQGASILTPEQDELLQQMLKSGNADKKHVQAILALMAKQSLESAFEQFKSIEMQGGRPVLEPFGGARSPNQCTGGRGNGYGIVRSGPNTVPYVEWKDWPQEKPPSFGDMSAAGRLQWAMARGIEVVPKVFVGEIEDLITSQDFKDTVAIVALGGIMLQLIPGANAAFFGLMTARLVATVGYAAATASVAEGIRQLLVYADLAVKAKNVEELELAAEAFAKAIIAFSGSVGASKAFKLKRSAKALQCPAPGEVPRAPLTIRERLAEYYNRLRGQPPAKTADEALERVRNTLDEVEDLHSGVPKRNPPPPLGQSDGRMHPPLDDFVTRNPNGSITARTRGHHIEIGSDGSITIKNLKTGDIEFQQPGGAGK